MWLRSPTGGGPFLAGPPRTGYYSPVAATQTTAAEEGLAYALLGLVLAKSGVFAHFFRRICCRSTDSAGSGCSADSSPALMQMLISRCCLAPRAHVCRPNCRRFGTGWLRLHWRRHDAWRSGGQQHRPARACWQLQDHGLLPPCAGDNCYCRRRAGAHRLGRHQHVCCDHTPDSVASRAADGGPRGHQPPYGAGLLFSRRQLFAHGASHRRRSARKASGVAIRASGVRRLFGESTSLSPAPPAASVALPR